MFGLSMSERIALLRQGAQRGTFYGTLFFGVEAAGEELQEGKGCGFGLSWPKWRALGYSKRGSIGGSSKPEGDCGVIIVTMAPLPLSIHGSVFFLRRTPFPFSSYHSSCIWM